MGGVAAVSLCAAIAFAQQSNGLPPRANAADYQARVSVAGVTYAASLVPAEEVKHQFAFDITKSYVVFEIALYPGTGSAADVDPNGFTVRVSQNGDQVRSADAATVASVIQQKNLPPPPSKTGPVVASTAIGYESGRDPYTGQRVHGTYTDTQVAVGRPDYGPPPMPSPGGYPQDRQLLENQLWAKSLPAGKLVRPIAGYLYFPTSSLKKKASGMYELEYLGSASQPVLKGSSSLSAVQLQIPAKSR